VRGFRDWLADLAHGFEVDNQGILEIPTGLFLGIASSGTAFNIRRIGGVACRRWFNDY